jgi:hypothetical protein
LKKKLELEGKNRVRQGIYFFLTSKKKHRDWRNLVAQLTVDVRNLMVIERFLVRIRDCGIIYIFFMFWSQT